MPSEVTIYPCILLATTFRTTIWFLFPQRIDVRSSKGSGSWVPPDVRTFLSWTLCIQPFRLVEVDSGYPPVFTFHLLVTGHRQLSSAYGFHSMIADSLAFLCSANSEGLFPPFGCSSVSSVSFSGFPRAGNFWIPGLFGGMTEIGETWVQLFASGGSGFKFLKLIGWLAYAVRWRFGDAVVSNP